MAQFGVDPNPAAIVFHDFFADCETDAVTGVLSPGVQALKNLENKFLVLGRNANAIVENRKKPLFALFFRGNSDVKGMFATKFNGIADQVLKKLNDLKVIRQDRGQRITGNGYVVLLE